MCIRDRFTDCTGHTGQPDTELIVQLFAYSTYTTVAQVVDIIYICTGIQQLDQIFDNLDHKMCIRDSM